MNKNRHAKLTSFRRSRKLENIIDEVEVSSSRRERHEIWRAPEALEGEEHYNLSADVYGWAVTAGSVGLNRNVR